MKAPGVPPWEKVTRGGEDKEEEDRSRYAYKSFLTIEDFNVLDPAQPPEVQTREDGSTLPAVLKPPRPRSQPPTEGGDTDPKLCVGRRSSTGNRKKSRWSRNSRLRRGTGLAFSSRGRSQMRGRRWDKSRPP